MKEAQLFTKRQVTISAIQWTGDNLAYVIFFTDGRMPLLGSDHARMKWEEYCDLVEREGLRIFTLEDGKMGQAKHMADIGDWIIKGVQGEFYPCKPDIFEMTYAPATASEPVAWTWDTASAAFGANVFSAHFQFEKPESDAAILRLTPLYSDPVGVGARTIEDCPELNMSNFTDVDVEHLNDWAIRADAEIDRLAAIRQPASEWPKEAQPDGSTNAVDPDDIAGLGIGDLIFALDRWKSSPVTPGGETLTKLETVIVTLAKKIQGQPASEGHQADMEVRERPIMACIMRDDGGEKPAFCVMAAFKTEQAATAALAIIEPTTDTPTPAPSLPCAGVVSTDLLEACRGSVKSDLQQYEQLLLRNKISDTAKPSLESEANRLRMLLDSIDAAIAKTNQQRTSHDHPNRQ